MTRPSTVTLRMVAIGLAMSTVGVLAPRARGQPAQASAPPRSVSNGEVASSHAGPETGAGAFARVGDYAYAVDPGQSGIIDRAVNRAVSHMFPIVRGIAHRRLMNTNRMPDTLRLIVRRDTLGTRTDRDKPMNLPRDGATVRWDDGAGDVCRARDSISADTLFQFCNVGRAESVARYVLADGGTRLRMIIHVTDPRLSRPLDYAIDFHERD